MKDLKIESNRMETIYIDKKYEIELESSNKKIFENGIEYARYLRRVNKYKTPIMFTSFLSKKKIFEIYKNPNIINAQKHYFLQLPYTNVDLVKLNTSETELTDIQLSDVVLNFCELKSSIRESYHLFKGRLNEINNKKQSKKEKLEQSNVEIENLKKILQRDYIDIPQVLFAFNALVSGLNKENIEEKINEISTLGDEVLSKYITSDNDTTQTIEPLVEKPWEVLFLDDKPDELAKVLELVKSRNVIYHIAESVKEAKKIIEDDTYNKIAVVVSDFRLFDTKSPDKVTDEQGYDFLIWLAKQPRINGLMALSGLSKWFLINSFNKLGINVKVFSKSNLAGAEALFVEELENLGEKYYDYLINQPTGAAWKNLKQYYAFYRNNKDYEKLEENICLHSAEIIEDIKKNIHSKDPIKQIKSISTYITESQSNFDNKTYQTINESTLKKFYDKLIIRRVLIYMYLWDENSLDQVCELLAKNLSTKSEKKEKEEKDKTIGNKKQIMTNCGLKEVDIPVNILSEEKNWLETVGVEVKGYKVAHNAIYDLFEFFFVNYPINEIKKLKDNFTKNKSLKTIEQKFEKLNENLKADSTNKKMIDDFYNDLKRFLNILDKAYINNNYITNFINQINGD